MPRPVALALVTIGLALGWVWVLPAAPVRQPFPFTHAKHQGIDCRVCHSGASTAAHAGIPDAPFCSRCHATPPSGAAAWNQAMTNRTFGWVRVERLPSHVLFSHQRHVTLGRLACESCHGDMQTRTVPVAAPPRRFEMTTCLGCHRQEGASEDCDACHR